ncbi:MAG: response regulator [Pseudomonadota bacterium]
MSQQGSILIVDDEAGPRESLRMILKPIYKVYTAANGKEALALIQKENIDLVTLDLNMPGLSGIDVLKEIKKIKSDVEVIIITGYGTLKNAQEVIRYGAGDFISKPFNVADIISIISKSFERRNYNLKINNLIQQIKGLRNVGEDQEREPRLGNKVSISS